MDIDDKFSGKNYQVVTSSTNKIVLKISAVGKGVQEKPSSLENKLLADELSSDLKHTPDDSAKNEPRESEETPVQKVNVGNLFEKLTHEGNEAKEETLQRPQFEQIQENIYLLVSFF